MRVLAEKKTMVSGLRVLISYEVAFKRSLRWLRRRLLDVLWCTPASSPSRRLAIILNANPYHKAAASGSHSAAEVKKEIPSRLQS